MNFISRSPPGVKKIQVNLTFLFIPKYQKFKNSKTFLDACIFCYEGEKIGELCDAMIL